MLRWTRVKVLYREWLSKRGGEVPHIARQIDSFLDDLPQSSLHETYEQTTSLHCVQLAIREQVEPEELYRDWEFSQVTALVSSSGDQQTLTWLAEKYLPNGSLTAAATAAAASGNLIVLKWLYDVYRDRVSWGGTEWCAAVRGGQAHVVKWLEDHVAPHEDAMHRVLYDAAKAGCVDIVQRLVAIDHSAANAALLGAWRGRQWEIYKMVAVKHSVSNLPPCARDAAEDGDLEFLQWILPLVPSSTVITSSHVKVLDWYYGALKQPLAAECMDEAAGGGHLEAVKWLDAHDCPATTRAMDDAASSGFLEVVQYLHGMRDEGCSVSAMEKAAGNGHLDVIQWLHVNRTEGCTERAMDWAAKGGHLDVIKWLHANRSEGCSAAAMDWAAHGGHLDVVKWLDCNRTEGCTSAAMNLAAAAGQLHVLKWLWANRSEGFTAAALDVAAAGGHVRVLQWLKATGKEAPSPIAMRDAVLNGHVPVMLFLYQEYGHSFCGTGISLLPESWEDTQIHFVGTAQWLLETFGEKLDDTVFRVHRGDWSTNKWLRGQNMTQLEIDSEFVYWTCGER